MNQEVKQKWVAALRSGDYVQGRGALVDSGDNFCCLGVLCELAVEAGVVERRGRSYDFGYATDLPPAVGTWAGFPKECQSNPIIGDNDAISLNDEERYTFDQIADEIERYL